MKKAPLLLTIGFLFVVITVLIYYNYFVDRDAVKVWDIIPSQTVLVYEVGECQECIDKVVATTFFDIIRKSWKKSPLKDSTRKLFSAVFDPENKGFVSLHLTQNDDFDFVFYLPEKQFASVEKELGKWKEGNPKFNQREFNGIKISEISTKEGIFSWTIFEKIWVGSYTPFLVEDVIRTYKSDGKEGFKNYSTEVFQLPRIKNDAGNLYLNLTSLTSFLSAFKEKSGVQLELGQSSLLDIKRSDNTITLNGFSLVGNTSPKSLLSCFLDQSPVPFTLKNFISNRALMATNYGISDGLQLQKNLDLFINKHIQDTLQSLTNLDFNVLYSGLGKEMALCLFESRGSALSRVLVIDLSNPEVWLKSFDQLSRVTERGDSLYYEKYSSYEIREIGIKNLPEKLFKPLITGFDQTYYSFIGRTLIIADQVEELRRFLDDIDKEEVWGKLVAVNRFLESTLLESNISVYVNTPRALSTISTTLSPRWKDVYSLVGRNSLSSLGFSAYQFSHLNESFYTNITWAFDSDNEKIEKQISLNRISASIDQPIISRPFIVKNYLTKKNEIVFQDSLFTIHYFSPDGKRQWKKELSGKIIGEVFQVDYLSNNKLQLFFVANNRLHVIDRLGNYVNPFPISINLQNVDYVSLIDYDNSKKYRFLVADKLGKLTLFDKEGKGLEGWDPKNVEGPLYTKANHHRIRGKDYILSIRKDGWVYLQTRRGDNLKGFPLNLDIRPDGDYFLESGATLATNYFVVVSRDGTKIKFNVEGKILSREPLMKAAVNDYFSLVAEKDQKSYLVTRQNSRQLTVFDESGKILVTNDFTDSNTTDVQYYDFGSGRSYIVVSDLAQRLCYVYDGQGVLLTPVPIDCTYAALTTDSGNVVLVTVNDQSLAISPLIN